MQTGMQKEPQPAPPDRKLTQPDKEAVKASLEAMTGKFADLALQELDRLF